MTIDTLKVRHECSVQLGHHLDQLIRSCLFTQGTVEDPKALIEVLASLIPEHKQLRLPEASRKQRTPRDCREFQDIRIIQEAACGLYDALVTACNAHVVHNVHLSLQPDLNGALTHVRFNVAFSGPVLENCNTSNSTWISVESIIKLPEIISEPSSRTFLNSTSSLKRRNQAEDACYPQKIKKHVHLQSLFEPTQSSRPAEKSLSKIPNIYLQRNFCTVLERFLSQRLSTCNDCIGFLGDNSGCKHLVYINSQTNGMATSASLSQLVSLSRTDFTKSLGLYERVRVAKYLATAVLYYHATPWLNESWHSEDVHFFRDGDGDEDHEHFLQAQQLLLYMRTSIRASDSPVESKSISPHYKDIIRNPVLFRLGIMFLELAYQAPLRDLQAPVNLKMGKTQGFADYFTAQRLAERSNAMVSQSFKTVVKKCLFCDFGHGNDFKSPALQEAFYHDVVQGLENLERVLRELQLNDYMSSLFCTQFSSTSLDVVYSFVTPIVWRVRHGYRPRVAQYSAARCPRRRLLLLQRRHLGIVRVRFSLWDCGSPRS